MISRQLEMIKKIKISIICGFVFMLAGCETAPERPLSPLEACLKDAKWEGSMCKIGQVGNVMAGANKGHQTCVDRQMMQEDRCYARFK